MVSLSHSCSYQQLFKRGLSKWMVFISVLPIILVTPLMKISVLLSTLFSQMVTFTTGSSFDPKIQTLVAINGSDIQVEKLANEYEVKLYEFLENSSIKKWFMPRYVANITYILGVLKIRNLAKN